MWKFSDATYDRTAAAFTNPDHVDIVIHNYRWRLSWRPVSRNTTTWTAAWPPIRRSACRPSPSAVTSTAPTKDGVAYRKMFTGPYAHRALDGIGHNVPQEAPQQFADAVMAADRL